MQNFFANWLGPLPSGIQSAPSNRSQIADADGNTLTTFVSKQEQTLAQVPAPQPVAQQPAPPPPAPEPEKKKKGWF
jgi:hypothetical protein